MKINRRTIALGLTAGLLAAGGGGALAATTAGSWTPAASATTSWSGHRAWGGYGPGPDWRGYATNQINSWNDDDGPMTLGPTAISATASYPQLTTSGLRSRPRSDKTLADLAISQHKSVSSLENAIAAAISPNVHADSALSTGQQAAIIANANQRIASTVDTTHPIGNASAFTAPSAPMTRTETATQPSAQEPP